jgi:hypothetical protein
MATAFKSHQTSVGGGEHSRRRGAEARELSDESEVHPEQLIAKGVADCRTDVAARGTKRETANVEEEREVGETQQPEEQVRLVAAKALQC